MADKEQIIKTISKMKEKLSSIDKFKDVIENAKVTSSISESNTSPESNISYIDPKSTAVPISEKIYTPSLYPNLNSTTIRVEQKALPNLDYYTIRAERQNCNLLYKVNNNFKYTDEQNVWRNDVLFNRNDSRFTDKNKTPYMNIKDIVNIYSDPLIYEKTPIKWPSYVKYIYYTQNSLNEKSVQVSKTTNLYLNYCLENQGYACLYRIGYYRIYELITKLKQFVSTKDVADEFINEQNLYIKSAGQLETWWYNDNFKEIVYNFNFSNTPITRVPVNETQITDIRYRDLFDYIPICMIPKNNSKFDSSNITYPDPSNSYVSNICYHKNNCHDNSCSEHNEYARNYHRFHLKHYENQPYYSFNYSQLIDINDLINYN